MTRRFEGPQELSYDDAVWRLVNATPPGAQKGRVWYDVARALYAEVLRLRAEGSSTGPAPSEEELIAAFNAAQQPMTTYTICSVTSKRSYASERAALEASRGIQHKLRTYFCDLCRGWHVTKEHR